MLLLSTSVEYYDFYVIFSLFQQSPPQLPPVPSLHCPHRKEEKDFRLFLNSKGQWGSSTIWCFFSRKWCWHGARLISAQKKLWHQRWPSSLVERTQGAISKTVCAGKDTSASLLQVLHQKVFLAQWVTL